MDASNIRPLWTELKGQWPPRAANAPQELVLSLQSPGPSTAGGKAKLPLPGPLGLKGSVLGLAATGAEGCRTRALTVALGSSFCPCPSVCSCPYHVLCMFNMQPGLVPFMSGQSWDMARV